MCLTERNCSDCSHYLLSDFRSVDAANLLMDCDLCDGALFSANCGSECVKGNRDAIDVFKLE